MTFKINLLLLFIGIIFFICNCKALRCRNDDGPSVEDVRRIIRTCMRKTGNSPNNRNPTYNNNRNYKYNDNDNYGNNQSNNRNNVNNRKSDYSNENSDENTGVKYYSNRNVNNDNNQYDNNNNNYGNQNSNENDRYKHLMGIFDHRNRMQWNHGYERNNTRNNENNNNNYKYNSNSNYNTYDSNNNNNNKNNNTNNSNRQTDQSKSCVVHCFFEEMNMTNQEGMLDKHKMIHVITKNIKDNELKDFYHDSIQECFHILEMGQRKDKCIHAKHMISCLTERAKANCDDFENETIIF